MQTRNTTLRFDADLLRRYDVAAPRYTSYPTAPQFHDEFTTNEMLEAARASNEELIPRPLSLYLHLPFCHSLCYYCGCTKKVTRHHRHGEAYLDRLEREIRMQAAHFDPDRSVQQLHLGGGTPTFFDDVQLQRLMHTLGSRFALSREDGEFGIEIDPRTVNAERIAMLADLGFNRFSLGIQDFDPDVQRAVNRVQSREDTLGLVEAARRHGARSVSVDLIYGLPLQTPPRFERTLEHVLSVRPDRLSIYSYAHLPQRFRSQRLIREADLPTPEVKLQLLELSIARLCAAGYRYIGMDHFALPDDPLSIAQDNGTLQRNFQGYSTHGHCDVVGMGVSAIGRLGDVYVQNHVDIPTWSSLVDQGRLPVWRGIKLTPEDRLRRAIIMEIMCHGRLRHAPFERRFGIDFASFFEAELQALGRLERDGIVQLESDGLSVTPAGRLLIRHVALVFDAYHQAEAAQGHHSRAI